MRRCRLQASSAAISPLSALDDRYYMYRDTICTLLCTGFKCARREVTPSGRNNPHVTPALSLSCQWLLFNIILILSAIEP
jgi:hypothetical protein